jgi:exodeoxyribonuclease X
MTRTIILDTETTGVTKTDQVIELGYMVLLPLKNELKSSKEHLPTYKHTLEGLVVSERYKPSVDIHPRAYDVHGINPSSLQSKASSKSITLPEGISYIIGHNISFDKRMLIQSNENLKDSLENAKYICTLALAKAIGKFTKTDYPNNTLSGLVEHYYPDHIESFRTQFHSAKNDVVKTLLVLLKLVSHLPALETYEDIWNFQNTMSKVKK